MSGDVRADLAAEETVIINALFSRHVVEEVVADLVASDFYRPLHAAVFSAVVELHENGIAVDPITVANALKAQGRDEDHDADSLREWQFKIPPVTAVSGAITVIRRESAARQFQWAILEASNALADQGDPLELADALAERIRSLDRGGTLPERFWPSLSAYLAEDHEKVGTALIPGVCYRHTRVLILATEKAGKSLFLRQLAMCAAAGVHPFTFKPIEPVKVLMLDAENDDEELHPTIQKIRALIARVVGGDDFPEPAMLSRPYGMDLRKRRDRSELEATMENVRPQLIVGGPIYKLLVQADNTSDPRHAERLQQIFDDIRRRWGCALMIEHHSPAGKPGQDRELRAIGGQRWAAWPEVTIALHSRQDRHGATSVDVRYPHPPRGNYRWPKRFDRATHAGEWLWTPVWDKAPVDDPPPPDLFDEQPF